MIIKYYNRVEATEVADLSQAERIVREERAAGKKRFHIVPKKELRDHLEFEEWDNEQIANRAARTVNDENECMSVRNLAMSILTSMKRERKLYHL